MNNNALLVANVTIRGVRPFLYNIFSPEKLSAEKKERTGTDGNDP